MPSTKPQDFPLLLEVFRDGLACGLISKDEIVAWADGIIKNDDEPDYFFIELSLSPDINGIAEVLDKYISWSKSPIPLRVIFGLIHQKLIADVINSDLAITFTERTPFCETLTPFEYGSIYEFEDYELFYPDNSEGLEETVVKFLSLYKDFNLSNYDQWFEINCRTEEILKEEKAKADVANEIFQKKWERRLAKQKLIRSIPFYSLFIIAIVIVVIDIITFETGTNHPTRIWYINLFGFYFIARWGYTYWKRSR